MVGTDDEKVAQIVATHWNARAAGFDRLPDHGLHSEVQHKAWLELLGRLMDKPGRALDLGCGTGFLALMLAELGHTVTGVDLAERMLDLAREKARRARLHVDFRLQNAAALSDPDGSYDLVIARHVIWTMPDPARAVAEWQRVLRPGGSLALIEGRWGTPPKPARTSPLRAIIGAIELAGLTVASYCLRRFGRLNARKYERVRRKLPFFGGPTADELTQFLRTCGLGEVAVEPLTSADLWEGVPEFSPYLVVAKRLDGRQVTQASR